MKLETIDDWWLQRAPLTKGNAVLLCLLYFVIGVLVGWWIL